MKVNSILVIFTLSALLISPAFAQTEWVGEVAAEQPEPVAVPEVLNEPLPEVIETPSTEIEPPPMEVAFITSGPAQPDTDFTTGIGSDSLGYEAEQPSYMTVYETETESFNVMPTVFCNPALGVVPEPSSIVALSTGLGAIGLVLRRRVR